jgi:hypothetical protein
VALAASTDLESVRIGESGRLGERTGFFQQRCGFSFDQVVRTRHCPVDPGHALRIGPWRGQCPELTQLDACEVDDLLRRGARLGVRR